MKKIALAEKSESYLPGDFSSEAHITHIQFQLISLNNYIC